VRKLTEGELIALVDDVMTRAKAEIVGVMIEARKSGQEIVKSPRKEKRCAR
jgi:hypothetical protein